MNENLFAIVVVFVGLFITFSIYLGFYHMLWAKWERDLGNYPIRARMSHLVGRGTQPEKLVKICRPEHMAYGWMIITVTRRSKESYNRVVQEGLRVQVEWVPFRWVADRRVKK